MTSNASELQDIRRRIETLESANRRLRRAGLAIALVAVVVVAMGQAKPTRSVEAQEFILRDTSGRERAALRMVGDSPEFVLEDRRERKLAVLRLDGSRSPVLSFYGRDGEESMKLSEYLFQLGGETDKAGLVQITAASAGPTIDTKASPEELKRAVEAGASLTKPIASIYLGASNRKGSLSLAVEGGDPNLQIQDNNGFETILGSTELVTPRTGETHKTSAASVVLFGKDSKILWSAP